MPRGHSASVLEPGGSGCENSMMNTSERTLSLKFPGVRLGARYIGVIWPAWVALILILTFYWIKFAYNAYLAATFPGEINYGEGVVWQDGVLIPGPRMYRDLQVYPFLIFPYPPFYYLVVRLFVSFGLPWLMSGRIVALASTAALAAIAAGLVIEAIRQSQPNLSRRSAFASACIAGLLLITFSPVEKWAYLMRVDMLAIALEILGMWLALISIRRRRFEYLASVVFVLAAFTRQTAILGAIAAFAVLVMRMPQRALRAAAFAVVLGGLGILLMTIATHGGFIQHIILYNMNHVSAADAYRKLITSDMLRDYAVGLAVAVTMAGALILTFRWRLFTDAPAGSAIILVYFLLSTLSLVSYGKVGADINYLIPWFCGWSLLIGLAFANLAGFTEGTGRQVMLLGLILLLLVQVTLEPPRFGYGKITDSSVLRQHNELVSLIRKAKKPVLSEDAVALMEAGKQIPWELSSITELTRQGLFNERKAIDMIEAHEFAFAIVTTSLDFRQRYSPEMSAALKKEFPAERRVGTAQILLPATGKVE